MHLIKSDMDRRPENKKTVRVNIYLWVFSLDYGYTKENIAFCWMIFVIYANERIGTSTGSGEVTDLRGACRTPSTQYSGLEQQRNN